MPFLKLDPNLQQSTDPFFFPFEIVGQTKGEGENKTFYIGVISDSHLFNSEDRDTYEEENFDWGLLDDGNEPDDSNWMQIGESDQGKKIWLEIEVSQEDQSIVNIEIRFDRVGTSGGWTNYPDPVEIDRDTSEHFQLFYHQIIGEITDFEEDPRPTKVTFTFQSGLKLQVTQLLRTNLMMTTAHTTNDANDPDLPLIVAIPWNGPTTDTSGLADEINDSQLTPWSLGEGIDVNDYSFKMFSDSNENNNFRILILDGQVLDKNGEGHTPSGMGQDDFKVTVHDDGDEIWLKIPHDADDNINGEVLVEGGTTTPDDVETGSNQIAYVTIGQIFIDFSDTPPTVTPHNTVCGDYAFDTGKKEGIYAFKMVDASEDSTAKVLIFDGDVIDEEFNEQTPQGMGNDDYTTQVEDGDNIWLDIPYNQEDGTTLPDSITIQTGQEIPDDSPGSDKVAIGYVEVNFDGEGNASVIPHNVTLGDYSFARDINSDYSFQMYDGTETNGLGVTKYQVVIADGDIIDQDDNIWTPDGMGDDNLHIEVQDEWEVYIKIDHDNEWNITANPTIGGAAETPDDTITTSYITIGYVNVDDQQFLVPHNQILGDYYFLPDPEENAYAFKGVDGGNGGPTATVRIYDGLVYGAGADGELPAGMGGDNFTITVSQDDEIWLRVDFDSNDQIIGLSIDRGSSTPEDTDSTSYITLMYIFIDDSDPNTPFVIPTNAQCGDIIISGLTVQDDVGDLHKQKDVSKITFTVDRNDADINDEGAIVEEGDDGEAVVHIGMTVEADDGSEVDGVGTITFTHDAAGNDEIVDPGDANEAIVHIGSNVKDTKGATVNGVHTFTFKGGTVTATGGDSNAATIEVGGAVTIKDDEGNIVNNVSTILFSGADTVSDVSVGTDIVGKVHIGLDLEDPVAIPVLDVSQINTLIFGYRTADDNKGFKIITAAVDSDYATVEYPNLSCYDETADSHHSGSPTCQLFFKIANPDTETISPNIVLSSANTDEVIIELPYGVDFFGDDDSGVSQVYSLDVTRDSNGSDSIFTYNEPHAATLWLGNTIKGLTGTEIGGVNKFDFRNVVVEQGAESNEGVIKVLPDLPTGTDTWFLSSSGGTVYWSQGEFSVGADQGFVDNISHLHFTIASDPSANYIQVTDGGQGTAIVYIPVLPADFSGFKSLVSDGGAVFWGATSNCGT